VSGIAGLIRFDGAPVEPGQVEKITGAIASRGPDGIAHWFDGSEALGQCMLRTTPESLEETQPLVSEDKGLVLVMDGRVDNGEQLRREILGRGGQLRDRSDAELVLNAYAIWGEQCPERIIGEFAFFIWDVRDRRLFGARDAAGTRHFYYHEGCGWFGFASEIRGLLALGRIEPRLNESRLLDYLVVEYDRDDEVGTFYQQIDRMPAGHAMSVTQRGARVWRYWEPGRLAVNKFASTEECAEAFLEQFRIAVKCRLRSLGPVGAMLSGGLDSSSIAGLIRKEFRDELKQPLRTFSLIREDRENCTDWKYIQEMLKDGWFDPAIITSAAAGNDCDGYVESIRNFDEPFSHCLGFVESFVYEAARAGNCNIVLDGMAADLFFYGPVRSMSEVVGRKMVSKIPAVLMAHRRHGIGRGLGAMAKAILAEYSPEVLRNAYQKIRNERDMARVAGQEIPGNNLRRLHRETGRRFLDAKLSARRQAESGVKPGNDQSSHACSAK
jgi:asparagine synthase (glutamine-hydrolysing)